MKDQATWDKGVEVFAKGKAQVIVRNYMNVYATFFLNNKSFLTDEIPTAAVDSKANFFFNPYWMAGLNVENIVFVICHEVEHIFRHHTARLGGRDPHRWNVAADAVINDGLIVDKIGEFIEGGVNMPGSRHKLTEQVYDELPNNPPPPPGQGQGEGEGEGGGQGGYAPPGGIGSDIIEGDGEDDPNNPREMSEEEKAENTGRIKAAIAEALNTARLQGNLSADMERRLEEALDVKTPWRDLLDKFMEERTPDDYSWRRPNRRHIYNDMYLPGLDSDNAMGTVVIGIDTSASIASKELEQFAAHFNKILEECRPSKVHVVYCDTQVAGVDSYETEDYPVVLEAKGGGGTDLRRIFDWVNDELEEQPAVCVVFTDGWTDWPSEEQQYPVFILTTDKETEYGTICVKYED